MTSYREYQQQVMKECLEDAKAVSSVSHEVGLPIIYKVAMAFFALRCKHSHYFEEEIKKGFKDQQGRQDSGQPS